MNEAASLWLFAALAFGIVALPGLDMAFVLGSALTGGRRRGLAALAGIVLGGVCHVLLTALGIGMLIRLVPGLFNALLVAGALYIAWIGLDLLRSRDGFGIAPGAAAADGYATFRRGLLTCLLNPKAYLFMLAVFPQFLRPAQGVLWLQALMLWVIIALAQCAIYGSIALAADRARGWLQQRPAAERFTGRCVGALLIVVALISGVEGWRRA